VNQLKRRPGRGDLVAAVYRRGELPSSPAPVVALVGRSNVGKSSLINRLLGRAAARTAKEPGKTRGIHFYETDKGFLFADLPGAGFARAPRQERERWEGLADELLESGAVTLALRLVDPRVSDAAVDRALRDALATRGVPSLAVATKWDRLSAAERVRARRRLAAEHGEILAVSARSGEGIEQLRREIRRRVLEVEENANG
jgi:GTP-binding protein